MRRLSVFFLFCLLARASTPTVVVNNSTGADTGTSGAPAAIGPVAALATCHTGGVASTTIQWAANGLSGAGVPTDGTAVLWLATGAGRQFSAIVGLAANTVTVEDSFNIALLSAVDCAVGGKRATLQAQLVADIKGDPSAFGWTLQLENTGTNYLVGGTMTFDPASGGSLLQGTGTPRPIIETTANATTFVLSDTGVDHLQFINTAGAKGSAFTFLTSGANDQVIQDCIFGGASLAEGFQSVTTGGGQATFYDNEIKFNVTGLNAAGPMLWNRIHDNTTGVLFSDTFGSGVARQLVFRNLIVNNTGVGASFTATGAVWLIENVIDGNGSHGLNYGTKGAGQTLVNNQITNNGGFGVTCTAATVGCGRLVDNGLVKFNNYFGNSSGARQNWPTGENETATDPGYFNRATGNYCITGAIAGGPPGPGADYPGTTTPSILEQGACQRAAGSSGAGKNLGI